MNIIVEYFEAAFVSRLFFSKSDDINIVQWFKYISNKEFSFRIRKGWEIFDKYYSKIDDSFFYAAALIFYPNRRTKYIGQIGR
jgi:hypothetical protein